MRAGQTDRPPVLLVHCGLRRAGSQSEVLSVVSLLGGAAGAWGSHLEIPLGKFLRFTRLHG